MRTVDLISKREALAGLSLFSERDRFVTARQMSWRNFDSSIVLGVAHRCRWGHPQVLACSPMRGKQPFPTTFWLSCPYLTYSVSRLESEGGVHDLENFLEQHSGEYRDYNVAYSLVRISLMAPMAREYLRRSNPKLWRVLRTTGIGGIRRCGEVTAKCLHLQLGTALALPGHPAMKWFKERLNPFSCNDGACNKYFFEENSN